MKRIKFINYLRQLPSNIVLKYLSDENSAKILTNGVYEEIVTRFYDKNYLYKTKLSMSDEIEREIFKIYFCGRLGKKISPALLRTKILKTFLAFEGVEENSERLFGFPDLADNVAMHFSYKLSQCQNQDLSHLLHFWGAFLADTTIILDMIQSGEAKVCNTGVYSLRWLDLIKERCAVGKLFQKYEDISKILTFVVNFLKSLNAKFSLEDGKYTLTSDIDDLLNKVAKEATSDLQKMTNKFSHTLSFRFLQKLVPCDSDGKQMKFDENEIADIREELDFSLKFFHWFGLIELFENFSFKLKVNDFPTFEAGHILPDFSVYIPVSINPWQFSKILYSTKIASVDVIYHGKIERKRLEESLANGVSEEEILEVLQEWRAPDSIEKTIVGWIKSFNRAFQDLPYVAFRNDIAQTIATHAQLAESLTPIDGYTFFRVKTGEEDTAFQVLEKMGFDLRRNIKRSCTPIEEGVETNNSVPLIKFNKNPSFEIKQEYILV